MMENRQNFRITSLFFFICIITIVTGTNDDRTFKIDYSNGTFLKDGKPFRYVSGSIHYFRVPREYWADRLMKMKYGGLNAIQTYVEWSTHEPEPGQYRFTGQDDLLEFIREAQRQDLLVLLRVGPYICAERDMGGFPYWLLKTPGIRLRTSDPRYWKPVESWFSKLLPMIRPLLYHNGGPIIMVGLENEYGSWRNHDIDYTAQLRNLSRKHLGSEIVLYTTDGGGDISYLINGAIPDTLATIDFNASMNVNKFFKIAQQFLNSSGPLVNSEYYSGWIDYWQEQHNLVPSDLFSGTLDKILAVNASVNIYMYHGGTNFGFKAGGNRVNHIGLNPVLTSYDYDAQISEAGDLTEKFFKTKKIIEKYFPKKNEDFVPKNSSEKMELSPIEMTFVGSIFDYLPSDSVHSEKPMTFESLGLAYGFVLYQTNLTFHPTQPAVLYIPDIRTRAHIFVDGVYQGIMSSARRAFNVSILAKKGSELRILVENEARCTFQCIEETRGIVSNVSINNNTYILENWQHFKLYDEWNSVIEKLSPKIPDKSKQIALRQPSFYVGNFTIPNQPGYPADTFLRLDGWTKGFAWLNGYNLGRYWPAAGSQITLYAPGVYFRKPGEQNQLVLLELDQSPCWFSSENCHAKFVKEHVINGSVPN